MGAPAVKQQPTSVAEKLANSGNKANEVKSGIKLFKTGEHLFKEKDHAESLFIIQKGQVRLFVQKGKGFVDIAVLRAGEVIGEMAYFDENASKRSCTAEAMSPTEVVEISFKAFEKTMQGINPWFRTIVNTLAERLRKTNDKVRALESNSVGVGSDGKSGHYVFFHNIDIVRLFTLSYMVFKSDGAIVDNVCKLHHDRLKLTMIDIFNTPEVKLEEFLTLLKAENVLTVGPDQNKLPKLYSIANAEILKQYSSFFNSQRLLEDSKRLTISVKCQTLLEAIMAQVKGKANAEGLVEANITQITNDYKHRNIPISEEDLKDAEKSGLIGGLVVNNGQITTQVQIAKLEKLFPYIRFSNAIKKLNEKKANNS